MERNEEEDDESLVNIDPPADIEEEVNYAPYRDVTEFPGYTQYEDNGLCCCCCCQCEKIYIPRLGSHFLGHWEIRLTMPIIVYTLAISAYIFLLVASIQTFKPIFVLVSSFILLLAMILFLYNYLKTITVGPGYYPFSLVHDDGMPPSVWSGIQSDNDQYLWVQLQGRPPRSTFFRSAHRYVIRPDHFCDLAATWIGKRNYKFFVLFNFYGVIYLVPLTVIYILTLVDQIMNVEKFKMTVLFAFNIIYITLGSIFSYITMKFFAASLWHAMNNITSWEKWNRIDVSRYKRESCCENLQDVCGERRCCYLCPTSPWKDFSNDAITCDYVSYDEC